MIEIIHEKESEVMFEYNSLYERFNYVMIFLLSIQ